MPPRRLGSSPAVGDVVAEATLPERREPPGAPAPHRWTWRSRWAAVFVVAWGAIQVFVPLWLLAAPRPARFAWQMYSATPSYPEVVALRAGGRRDTLSMSTFLAAIRYDLSPQYRDLIGPHVCRVVPGLQAVDVRRYPTSPVQRLRCREGG